MEARCFAAVEDDRSRKCHCRLQCWKEKKSVGHRVGLPKEEKSVVAFKVSIVMDPTAALDSSGVSNVS